MLVVGKIDCRPEKYLPTGQVSGALGIPLVTMQRYIKEFSEFFSPTARQTNRGRRFNRRDVQMLRVIRLGFTRRASREEIRGDLTAAAAYPDPDPVCAFEALDLALSALGLTQQAIKEIDRMVKHSAWANKAYTGTIQRYWDDNGEIWRRMQKLENEFSRHRQTNRHKW